MKSALNELAKNMCFSKMDIKTMKLCLKIKFGYFIQKHIYFSLFFNKKIQKIFFIIFYNIFYVQNTYVVFIPNQSNKVKI